MSRTTLRVVLAPRAAVDVRHLLDEAALLARAMDAELSALFVEEPDLLHAVGLPFSVEVGLVSGAVRPANPDAMRRLLARQADELRTLVAQIATGSHLPWSFDVAHGDLIREALTAAAAAPVLLAPPRSAVQHALGPTPARRGGVTVAVLEEPMSSAGPAAERARAAAFRFAEGRPDAVARVRLEDLVAGPAPRLLVVPLAITQQPGMLKRVLASARCPVVLVC